MDSRERRSRRWNYVVIKVVKQGLRIKIGRSADDLIGTRGKGNRRAISQVAQRIDPKPIDRGEYATRLFIHKEDSIITMGMIESANPKGLE